MASDSECGAEIGLASGEVLRCGAPTGHEPTWHRAIYTHITIEWRS